MSAQTANLATAENAEYGDLLIADIPGPSKPAAALPYAAGPRLLLVEDEPIDRLQIRRLLQKSCIPTTLDEAESVATARAAIAAQQFDCVLLDYNLGDGGGNEVMASIKQAYSEHAPAVVFVTGQNDEDLVFRLLKSGAVDVIAKDGLTPAALKFAVETALSRRSAQPGARNMLQLDPVTLLPGLNSFEEALEGVIKASVRAMKPAMIFMVEIANFVSIVDSVGAEVGDTLLKSIVSRLKTVLRTGDVVARVGVNRFALIARDLPSASVAGTLSARTMNWLRQPYDFLGGLEVDFRMGVSICPHDGHGTVAVMRATEAALATTRQGAAGGVRFYKAQLGRRMDRRRELTADLASAIEKNQLQMLFQPVIDCTSGRMESVSAEMRWQHPVHGPVASDEFLPLAEAAGLIGPIGEWALDESCDAMAVWQTLQHRRLCCSLPVGHSELSGGYLTALVRGRTGTAGIALSQVTLRFNVSVLAHNSKIVMREIKMLAEAGIQLAVEDVGDPDLPIAELETIPVQLLSLSPSFVNGLTPTGPSDDVRRLPLLNTVAAVKERGIRVIATGIASNAQLLQARACGVSLVQGDFISPPLTVDDLAVWRRGVSRAGIWNRRGEPQGAA